MAINPPTDIIADVMSAAEPGRAASVEARLKSIASAPVGNSFADVVERKATSAADNRGTVGGPARMPARVAASSDPAVKGKQALVDFEGAILGILFSEVIPKEQSSVRGGAGSSNDVWRSMLSNEIGRKIAKSGALKLHERLFRTHPLGGATEGAARATQMSANALSQSQRSELTFIAPGVTRGRRS